jgi:hypothetical protein
MPINNVGLYNAVIAGAGGNAQQVSVNDPVAVDYLPYANSIAQIAAAVDAAVPAIIGGPTLGQEQLMQSIAAGVFSNRYPKLGTSYISTSAAIAALFTELSGKLQGGGGGPSTEHFVFVSGGGNDVTGDGTENNPYATVGHALSTILDASVTKIYQIVIIPGMAPVVGDIALKPYVVIEGLISADVNVGLAFLNGNVTLDFAAWADPFVGQTAWLINVEIGGSTTIDWVTAGSSFGSISFKGVMTDNSTIASQNAGNGLTYDECSLAGNFFQSGGFVEFRNTNSFSIGTLSLSNAAANPAIMRARGGSWAGPVTLDQNGDDSAPCEIDSFGFNMSSGAMNVIGTAITSPIVNAAYGDTPENVHLSGAAAVLTPQMRVSILLANFAPNPTAIAGAGVTTLNLALPAADFGATPIERMCMTATATGNNWGTFIGPHNCAVSYYFFTNAGVPNVSVNIYNPGGGFNIGADSVDLLISGYLPI